MEPNVWESFVRIGTLVRRDRARREQELTLEELRQKLAASRESGVSNRTVDDIFAEAREIAKVRGLMHE